MNLYSITDCDATMLQTLLQAVVSHVCHVCRCFCVTLDLPDTLLSCCSDRVVVFTLPELPLWRRNEVFSSLLFAGLRQMSLSAALAPRLQNEAEIHSGGTPQRKFKHLIITILCIKV